MIVSSASIHFVQYFIKEKSYLFWIEFPYFFQCLCKKKIIWIINFKRQNVSYTCLSIFCSFIYLKESRVNGFAEILQLNKTNSSKRYSLFLILLHSWRNYKFNNKILREHCQNLHTAMILLASLMTKTNGVIYTKSLPVACIIKIFWKS